MKLSDLEFRRQYLAGQKGGRAQAEALARDVRGLAAEYNRVQARIRAVSPVKAALAQVTPMTVQEAQSRVLDGETLLLEYMLGEEASHLWALTEDSLRHFDLPGRRVIENLALQVYQRWAGGPARTSQLAPGAGSSAVSDLADLLLGPVRSLLGTKRVLVVPDGCLQYIPFGALPDPAHGGQPLVWSREVVLRPLRVRRRCAS